MTMAVGLMPLVKQHPSARLHPVKLVSQFTSIVCIDTPILSRPIAGAGVVVDDEGYIVSNNRGFDNPGADKEKGNQSSDDEQDEPQ